MPWDRQNFPASEFPVAPFNGEVVSPLLQKGILDVRWDNPAILSANTPWTVLGVNIYRSDGGEYGPYHRLNPYPLGGNFYRDFIDNVLITQEIVSWDNSWRFRGAAPNDWLWVLCTKFPIVKASTSEMVYGNAPTDVTVTIEGVEVPISWVFGLTGEVALNNQPFFDQETEDLLPPVLPSETSTVLVTYRTNKNVIRTNLDRKIFYRLATVAEFADAPGNLIETPLLYCQPLNFRKIESMDWIWREAIRRNTWIREQGGERVKIFIKKTSGVPCDCGMESRRRAYGKQHKVFCLFCYGSGFVGGYEGPYEAIIAPDDVDRVVQQTERGRTLQHTGQEHFIGPSPLLTMRDFLVTQDNERYSIGGIRKPSNRGNVLQQHFTTNYLDETDIRYKIPIDGLADLPWPQTRTTVLPDERILVYPLAEYGPMHRLVPSEHDPQLYQDSADYQATPMGTEKRNIGDSREHRGRTQAWEDQNYLWWLVPFALWLLQRLEGIGDEIFRVL